MENRDYLLKVKYSITEVSDKGKQKIYTRKSEKSLTEVDLIEIVSDIDKIRKELKPVHSYFITRSHGGFFSSVNDFINKWKNAYYEMLTL